MSEKKHSSKVMAIGGIFTVLDGLFIVKMTNDLKNKSETVIGKMSIVIVIAIVALIVAFLAVSSKNTDIRELEAKNKKLNNDNKLLESHNTELKGRLSHLSEMQNYYRDLCGVTLQTDPNKSKVKKD